LAAARRANMRHGDQGFRHPLRHRAQLCRHLYNNCFKNGILPIALPQEVVDVLMKDAEKGANARMSIDLEAQTVTTSDGEVFTFEVDAFKKHCLMEGLDDIGLTMAKADSIDSFEAQASLARPWV